MSQFFTLLLLSISLLLFPGAHGLAHHLKIRNDERRVFKIETFGFLEGAKITVNVKDFGINMHSDVSDEDLAKPSKMGFVLRKAKSENSAQQDLEAIIAKQLCIFDKLNPEDLLYDLSERSSWKISLYEHTIQAGEEGLYSFIFARCDAHTVKSVNFNLDASFINPGPNYLSAGDECLPSIYFLFFLFFTAALLLWAYAIYTAPARRAIVHRIHYLMGALLVLKCITLLFESIRLRYIAEIGVGQLWSVLYFVFAFLKGVMLFTVIMLIGSGWSLMKSYLNDREKYIIMFVLALQVLDNVIMVILEESSPGSVVWITWRDILHGIDIACCLAILFPIVWSIQHLRQAADADGKASANLAKLQLFRQFYIIVIAYIYFTRIAVYLISASVSYQNLWLGDFSTELVTFLFYVVTGFKFRPAPDNIYSAVSVTDLMESQASREFGLLDDFDEDGDRRPKQAMDVEMSSSSISGKMNK